MNATNFIENKKIAPSAEFIIVASLTIIPTVLWVIYTGGTISWDAMNHHLYLGREALYGSRLSIDEFAVGGMSCQYPLSYAPLVAMLDAGWSGTAIFSTLALFSSLSAIAIWIVLRVIVIGDSISLALVRCLGALIACSGTLWWQMMVQTSNDAISATVILIAFSLAFYCHNKSSDFRFCLTIYGIAGALSAIAVLAKMTQVIGVLSILCVIPFLATSWQRKFFVASAFFSVFSVTLLVLGWKWGREIWNACGSPVHPFGIQFFSGFFSK